MKKRNMIYILKASLFTLLLLMVANFGQAQMTDYKRNVDSSAVDKEMLANADKFSADDSIRIAQEYGKTIFQDRKVYLWNRKVTQKYNIGAVSTIYSDDINTTPVRDISNVVAGRLPGLSTQQQSGKVGFDGANFTLRGQTPILVIDGVIRNFTNFNPDDIKSITVLDDAVSTAMYGLRSSNGVISIITKDMGLTNFDLNFSAQYGVSAPLDQPKFLDASNYAKLYNEAQLNDNPLAVPKYGDSLLSAYKNGTYNPILSPNVDWYNQVVKKNTNLQRYSINLGGYGKSYHYYASLEHFRQGGNFITDPANGYNTNNDYKRYNVRLNATVDFNKDISLAVNLFGSIVNTGEPGATADGILSSIYQTPPLAYPVFNPDSSYAGSTIWRNNIYASTVSAGYYLENQRTINEDIKLRYNLDAITPGLWSSAAVSINSYYYEKINRSKTFAVYQYNPGLNGNADTYTKFGSNGVVSNGSYSLSQQYNQAFYNILMGYNKAWSNSKLDLLGTFNVDSRSVSLSQLNQLYKTAGLTTSYSWKDKYLGELALAYSGLNYYPPGKRWAFLPSLGLGWIISNESFFHADKINYLKLRGSIGQTAWGDPGYFSYIQNYILNGTGYNVGSTATSAPGAYENGVANNDITWEKAWKWDIGLEMAAFDSKFNLTLDYYNNKYYDQLINPLNNSGIIGNTYPQLNVGQKRYSGAELSLAYNSNQPKSRFNYFVKGNISLAKNKVLFAAEPNYPYSWMYHQGLPAGTTFGYEAIGFYNQNDNFQNTPHIAGYIPQAGDIKFKDLNGDGTINFLDEKSIGTTTPMIFYGLNVGFKFIGFDLSALIQGVQNRNIYIDPTSPTIQEFYNGYGNAQSFQLNRWTPENAAKATYPRLSIGGNANNTLVSSFWMKNDNFLRLKNVELGYSLPAGLLKRIKVSQIRFFVNAYNLFTISHLKDFNLDPESGVGYFSNQRVINTGISIKL